MKSPVTLLLSLWKDFQRLNPDVKGLDRDLVTIESRFENEGYGFLTVALPALGDALVLGLSSGEFACPIGFKTIKGGAIPRFLSGMFSEVFEPFSGKLKPDADKGIVKCLREGLQLFKKTKMPAVDEELLHRKAVSQFFQCDDQCARFIMPDREDHLIGLVSKIVLNSLSSEPLSLAQFKHGPGAVFEGYSANQKWSALSDSVKNAEFDLDSYGYGDFSVNLTDLSERTEIAPSMDQVFLEERSSRSIARLITVPKNSTSRRTITVEPMLNQFIQQGLNILLRDSIERCKILSNCLALTNQSLNQKLALEGSLLDNWATIDLKSASDLLSVKLVESVFRHHGHFFDHMMECRSTSVSSDIQSTTNLGKFAGMGNALTFPVQSVCFAVICIAAIHDKWGTKPTYRSVMRATRHIRVYGDDIIVSREFAHQCVNWLQDVGLIVNVKKSFLRGNFKESCGVEAFRGVDITPLYIRHRPDQTSADPELIGGYVSLSNHSWMEGLYSFSSSLREIVEDSLGKSLPLVSRRSGVLGWHSRQDAMTARKWCPRTQQFLTRTFALTPLKRRDRLSGYAALLKFFHVPLLGRDRNHLESTAIRYKKRILPRWVPTRVFETD